MAITEPTALRRSRNGRFAEDEIRKSDGTNEKSGPQQTYVAGSWYFPASGGSWENPMGFPGYGSLYNGSYDVYRWMRQHPVIAFVNAVRTAPILASTWEATKVNKSVSDEWRQRVSDTFTRLRQDLIQDYYIRGTLMGWSPGEPIWVRLDDGFYDIQRVKPLAMEATQMLKDKYGRITGLVNHNPPTNDEDIREVRLSAPYKAFWYAYDDTENAYGRSWLENCRTTAWKRWLDCAQQLQRLGAKISGVVTIIMSPSGTFVGPDGKEVTYASAARDIIKGLAAGGAGAWWPTISLVPGARGGIDVNKVLEKLFTLTKFEVIDFSGNAQGINPILEEMKHQEELMFNAGLRSARSGLEAKHGTKEEAGVHTDTGTTIAECEDQDFATNLQPLVDALLTANYGPRAAGTVVIKPPSLIDRKAAILRAFLMALMNEPGIRLEMGKSADVPAIFKALDIPETKPYDGDAAEESNKKQGADLQGSPEPEGGRPKPVAA